jgi:signal peptidase I
MASHARKTWLRESFDALLVALVFAVFARTWVVQAFKIPTGSMEENLMVGDHILVNKFVYGPTRSGWEEALLPIRPVERGDVVVFKYPEDPERDFIKRCLGLPGEVVEIADKRLHVDGEPLAEEGYTRFSDPETYPDSSLVRRSHGYYWARDQYGPYEVPPGHYFCLGDNRDRSQDSRFWGPVPRELVKGRALLIYWSVPQAGAARDRGASGPWWRRGADALRELGAGNRWERSFTLVR